SACVVNETPVVFAAGHFGDGVFAWELATAEGIDIAVHTAQVVDLVTGVHEDRDLLYTVNSEGLIEEWDIHVLLDNAERQSDDQRGPKRAVQTEEGITTLAVHPELGLVVS